MNKLFIELVHILQITPFVIKIQLQHMVTVRVSHFGISLLKCQQYYIPMYKYTQAWFKTLVKSMLPYSIGTAHPATATFCVRTKVDRSNIWSIENTPLYKVTIGKYSHRLHYIRITRP